MLQVRGRDVNRMRINEAASRLPRCFERVFRFSKPLRQLRLFESPLASKRNSGPRWRVVGRERRLPRPSDRSVGISPPFRGPCLWANGPSNFALRHVGFRFSHLDGVRGSSVAGATCRARLRGVFSRCGSGRIRGPRDFKRRPQKRSRLFVADTEGRRGLREVLSLPLRIPGRLFKIDAARFKSRFESARVQFPSAAAVEGAQRRCCACRFAPAPCS